MILKMRGITERARQTRMDERRLAMLEAMEQELQRAQGGLTPEALELMKFMLVMIQN